MQTLTNIESNLVFSDEKSKVTANNLNNGDVVFCPEDKSITLKYNDSLHNMGGSSDVEIDNASDTVKGITKISDAIDRDDSTVAATSKAIKTSYNELLIATTNLNRAYSSSQSSVSRIEVIEESLATKLYDGPIIGIACNGNFNYLDGAYLAWIDDNFNEITELVPNYFDNHLSFKFEETTIGSDQMIKIPLCYWWRGTIPKGPYQGKWGMLLSPTADPGIEGLTFKPNYVAFMDKGTLKHEYYYSKYKMRNISNSAISQYSGDIYYPGDVATARTLAAKKGTGWHMITMQQYHDILARAVIEKKTFNIIPYNEFTKYDGCSYRGIMELGGMIPAGYASSMEFMDGIQIPAGTNKYYQVFDNVGNRTWVNTDMLSGPEYCSTFRTGQYFDNLFINKDAGADGESAITSDFQYLPTSNYSYICTFYAPDAVYDKGCVFGCQAWDGHTYTASTVSFRLGKF